MFRRLVAVVNRLVIMVVREGHSEHLDGRLEIAAYDAIAKFSRHLMNSIRRVDTHFSSHFGLKL